MWVCVHACVFIVCAHVCVPELCAYVHVYVCLCMHVGVHACLCVHLCICVYMCVCRHTCADVISCACTCEEQKLTFSILLYFRQLPELELTFKIDQPTLTFACLP